MHIKSAEFVTSAVKPAQYPPVGIPEIAFAGRSNVGKSSLINILVNRRRLVKTSGRPGRTQLINFFIINDAFHLVDLPGYGYAKVPESVRRQWGPMIERYLTARESLKGVVLILDIRRTPGEEELNFIDWLAHHRLPCILVCTKADKLSKNKRKQQLHRIAGVLDRSIEDLLLFSAKTRLGKESVWSVLEALIEPGSERHDRG